MTGSPSSSPRYMPALLLVLCLCSTSCVSASEANAQQRAALAAMLRQIDLINHLVEHSASVSTGHRSRYHFDHARLREDLQRVRAGIQDYLTPPRAQPRDPVELSGDYRQSSPPSDEEAPQ